MKKTRPTSKYAHSPRITGGNNKPSLFSASIYSTKRFLGSSIIQTKLKIGRPGDKYEHKADRGADVVTRMQDPQLKMLAVEEEEKLQMQPIEKNEEVLQMKPSIQMQEDDGKYAPPKINRQINASKGQGSSIPLGIQQEMSRKIGADFSNVKVHTNSKATQMNRNLNASAFTHGMDIYFNKGEYDPGSTMGKHLLAHELTHVVQQVGNGSQIQRKNKIKDCSETKKEQIKVGIKSAKKMAQKAVDALKKEELKLMHHERKAMQSNFGSANQKMKEKVIERYESIISKLNSKIITCKKECPNDEETKVTCGKGEIPGEKIYICPSFGDICEPGETILHEAAHNEGAHHGEDGAYDNANAFEKFAVAVSVKKKAPEIDLGEKKEVKVPSFDE